MLKWGWKEREGGLRVWGERCACGDDLSMGRIKSGEDCVEEDRECGEGGL